MDTIVPLPHLQSLGKLYHNSILLKSPSLSESIAYYGIAPSIPVAGRHSRRDVLNGKTAAS
jgi:hypothetical protein